MRRSNHDLTAYRVMIRAEGALSHAVEYDGAESEHHTTVKCLRPIPVGQASALAASVRCGK